jgi:hypothetical protein
VASGSDGWFHGLAFARARCWFVWGRPPSRGSPVEVWGRRGRGPAPRPSWPRRAGAEQRASDSPASLRLCVRLSAGSFHPLPHASSDTACSLPVTSQELGSLPLLLSSCLLASCKPQSQICGTRTQVRPMRLCAERLCTDQLFRVCLRGWLRPAMRSCSPVCGFGSRASPALRSQNRHRSLAHGERQFSAFSKARPAVARLRSRGPVGAFKSSPHRALTDAAARARCVTAVELELGLRAEGRRQPRRSAGRRRCGAVQEADAESRGHRRRGDAPHDERVVPERGGVATQVEPK